MAFQQSRPVLAQALLLLISLATGTQEIFAQSAPAPYLGWNDGSSGDIVMTRVQVQITAPYTYYETMGGNSGENGGWYCGIQDSGDLGKNYIFSLWDPVSGGGAATVIYANPSGISGRFGGEGAGVHYLNYSLPWKINQWYRIVARTWDYDKQTYYGFWTYDESAKAWTQHATLAFPAAGYRFSTVTSAFVEDFGLSGQNVRRSAYNDGWKRVVDGSGSRWQPYSVATFTEGGSGTYANAFDAGVKSGAYYMQTGGNTVPTLSDGSNLDLDFTETSPALSTGRVESVTSSYDRSASRISVSWITDQATSPQFSYKVDVFSNPEFTGTPVLSESDVTPQRRSTTWSSTALGTSVYYARVSITDIFDQAAVPVSATVTNSGLSPLTISLTSTPDPALTDGPVEFVSTVLSAAATPPTGTLTFRDGATILGKATLASSGRAVYVVSSLAHGTHQIEAAYSGDTNYAANASPTLSLSVLYPTTTMLTSSGRTQTSGGPVTFTSSVSSVAGAGTPEGNVVFAVDGVAAASITLNSAGSAAFTTETLKVGNHTVLATYQGNTGYESSHESLAETITEPVAATPSFTPTAGSYAPGLIVKLADTTLGATIYYTTNETTPTTASTKYTGPITVASSEYIKAIAIAPGYSESAVATGAFHIEPLTATPTFTPPPGSYAPGQTVKIGDATPSATVYYTTNGTTPTTASAKYTSPIPVQVTETIKAIAIAAGDSPSAVASAAYTIHNPVATPKFSPGPGTYTSIQTVAITDATAGAVIHYTTNGSQPTAGSPVYKAPIVVSSSETLAAIAMAPSYVPSAVATAAYTLDLPPAATPTITPASGSYSKAQIVTIADSTPNAVIHYTKDGSVPTAASTRYFGPFYAWNSETIKAVAIATGYSDSPASSVAYQLPLTPIITTAAGGGPDYYGEGVPATESQISANAYATADPEGDLYIADFGNSTVRKVDAKTGMITTVAGIGVPAYTGDGYPALEAGIGAPSDVSLDAAGNLYIADPNDDVIRKVTASTGIISTIAGATQEGDPADPVAGYSGDGGPATKAKLNFPSSIAVNPAGDVYIADLSNFRIRKVDAATGIITTVAGNGVNADAESGVLATKTSIGFVDGIKVDAQGNILYVGGADVSNVYKIDVKTGILTTLLPGMSIYSGYVDSGEGCQCFLSDVAVDGANNLYVATMISGGMVYRVDGKTGAITQITGRAYSEYLTTTSNGDGGPAINGLLGQDIYGVSLDAAGELFISDTDYNTTPRIRKVAPLP